MAQHVHDSPATPTLLTFYNAFSLGNLRNYRVLPWSLPHLKAKFLWLYAAFSRLERECCSRFTTICTVSPVDSLWVQDRDGVHNVETIPIPIDPEFLTPRKAPRSGNPLVLVLGLFSHEGIAQSAIEFLAYAQPLIRSRLSSARIALWSKALSTRLARMLAGFPEVERIGYVDDYLGLLDAASICVIPQRCDSGVQVKAQQAMARGIPVVASPEICAGLGAVHGTHALIYRNPREMGEHVVELLHDTALAEGVGAAGRELMIRSFAPEVVGAHLLRVYDKTIARFRASPKSDSTCA